MPRSIWSGSISFGLVNIPVKLYTATQEKDVRFHQLHDKDKSRVRYQVVCAGENEPISRDEIVKGYEIAPDQYVVINQEELDALEPEKSRRIDIAQFVNLAEIDPVYFDRPYYLLPEEHAAKAYKLLVEAMTRAGKVAVAKFVMRNKEYLVALRPVDGAICLETMHFADEVTLPKDLPGLPEKIPVNEKEVKMAEQLIDTLADSFDPNAFQDEYRQRIQDLIEKKAQGAEIVTQPPPAEEPGKVIDLMAALEKSLESARKSAKHGRKKTA